MRKAFKILTITTLALTLALPFTAYAGTWQQDSTGWKVQSDGGTYLTSQWYQSPESGLFYYIGADGYMLTSTTTPDGYQVGADGAWIQPVQSKPVESKPAPQVEPTQSKPEINNPVQQPEVNNNRNTDTTEKPADVSEQEWQEWLEFDKLLDERGKHQEDNDVGANGGHAGYDDTGEINIGGGY